MDYHHCCSLILGLTSFLIISFSTADDAAIMAKLSKSISPTPSTWHGNNFCKWEGIACDYGSVIRIDLSFRSLTGTLPSEINSLHNLRTLAIQGNSLSGTLPTLSNLASLEEVILDYNNFTSIPSDLFYGLASLRSFSISLNLQLSPWSLSNNLTRSTNLQTFQANRANIYGTIPDIFYWFPNLQNLSLSYNNLTGNLPASFRGSRIQNLMLNNQLQGLSGMLDVLSTMTQLIQVLLEGNAFTGAIPQVLTSLPDLEFLDLSYNNLSGPVPVFPTRLTFSSENNLLLGKRIISENINTTDSSGGSAGLITGIVISGVIFVIGVILFVSNKCYRVSPSKLQSEISVDHSEIPSFKSGNLTISVQVLQQVTDNFSDEKVLGRGGFGVVYKGEFDDGTKIAVKRMKTGMKETKGVNEFKAEIAVLTKVRHRHLVALLGYCANDNERILVYEYMPQGTLSQHLFKWRDQKSLPVRWKQRVSIALDVGRGVEYLHSLAQQSFIHRDLKPANILLGDDMRAKVADFGLVKNAPDGKYSIETRLAGTFGYMAPEYSQPHILAHYLILNC